MVYFMIYAISSKCFGNIVSGELKFIEFKMKNKL